MPDSLVEFLKTHKENQALAKEKIGSKYITNNNGITDFVCTTDDGRLIDPRYLTHTYQNTLRKLGIEDSSLHKLRGKYGSDIYALTKDLSIVQKQLGHSDITTTGKYYIKADDTVTQTAAYNTEILVGDLVGDVSKTLKAKYNEM